MPRPVRPLTRFPALCNLLSCALLQVPVAIAAWRGLLEGRFRLLDRWCGFMSSSYKQLVVTEDTWTQVRGRSSE